MSARDVTIRPVELGDLPAIVEMIGGLAVHHGDVPGVTVQHLATELLRTPPSISILVADGGTALAGYVLLQLHFVAISGRVYANVDHFFVVAEQQRQGIGRKLMDEAVRTAAALGCYGLQVQATRNNWAAQSIYTALGFERSGTPVHFWRST